MIKIKLSFSSSIQARIMKRQMPGDSAAWSDCHFFVNQKIGECDLWVVFEDLLEVDSCSCPSKNTILITGEPSSIKNYSKKYLSQFSAVITSQTNLSHQNIINDQQSMPWHIGLEFDKNDIKIKKKYLDFKTDNSYKKIKLISVISSNKAFTKGHKKRLEFVQNLKRHFGDKIDVYGRGINEISDKWDAIAPYKYHVAIENAFYDDYWTEKLADSYLGEAFPIYYGCPNLEKYFSPKSFKRIDINDLDSSIKTITEIINSDTYEKSIPYLREAEDMVLDKYNLFPMVVELCKNNIYQSDKKELITIKPQKYFDNIFIKVYRKIRGIV